MTVIAVWNIMERMNIKELTHPTQQCNPSLDPCAGDMREDEDALHLCSIGA